MSTGSSPHELQAIRLHGLITRLSGQLAPNTVELAQEMADANEAPLALDMISEMLVEGHAHIALQVFDEIEDLAAGLGLDPVVSERLRPLVGG
ncbi:MAG: MafI family immunity protein [Gaiellaceae bacterium]